MPRTNHRFRYTVTNFAHLPSRSPYATGDSRSTLIRSACFIAWARS